MKSQSIESYSPLLVAGIILSNPVSLYRHTISAGSKTHARLPVCFHGMDSESGSSVFPNPGWQYGLLFIC